MFLLTSCGSAVERVDEKSKTKKSVVEITSNGFEDGENDGIDDWVLIRSIQAEWHVVVDEDESYDEHCLYEFYYSKNLSEFKLVFEGYKPKNHSTYKSVSKIMGAINKSKLSDDISDLEIIEELQSITIK